MKRVEFKLTMPGSQPSWNGKWSGEGRNYAITRTLSDKAAEALFAGKARPSWGHRWNDGWFASIEARVVPKGERLAKSEGFCGYEWMVANILDHGDTYERKQEMTAP